MADNQQSGSQSGNQPKSQLSWGQSSSSSNNPRPASTPAPTSSDVPSSSRLIGVFVVGLIIGLLIAWAWFDLRGSKGEPGMAATSTDQFAITETPGNSQSSETSENTGSESPSTSGTASGLSVHVAPTQKAGYAVAVTSISASAEKPVWAVVYSNPDRSGQVMGAGRFAAKTSGTIELVHPLVAGRTYYVGLVSDTPAHTYATRVNQPILGSDGKQILTQFVAQ